MAAGELAIPRQLSFLTSPAAAGHPTLKDRSHLLSSAESLVGMNDFAPSLALRTTLINPPRFCRPILRKHFQLSIAFVEKSANPQRHIRKALTAFRNFTTKGEHHDSFTRGASPPFRT
jgi:hypothetical protein